MERQKLVTFSGDITDRDLKLLGSEFEGIIETDGNLISRLSMRIKGSILVRGNIVFKGDNDTYYDFDADGDIICYGDFEAGYVTSKGKVYCYGKDKTYCIKAEKGVSYGKNDS